MPAKGSPIVPVRISPALLAEIDQEIKMSQDTRSGEPWCRSSFIIQAICDKLAHRRRSRAKKVKANCPLCGRPTTENDSLQCEHCCPK